MLGKLMSDENEIIESDYVIYPEPIPLMQATSISIENSPEITNHIVLCGIHHAIYYFILPLRAKYLKEKELKYILAEADLNTISEKLMSQSRQAGETDNQTLLVGNNHSSN